MTRSSAREIAIHIIFSLGFDTRSAREVLDAELTHERFQELGEEPSMIYPIGGVVAINAGPNLIGVVYDRGNLFTLKRHPGERPLPGMSF